MTKSEIGLRRARIFLLVTFSAILLVLVYLGVTVPEIKSFPAYVDREPITIHGDSELDAGNGVTEGSGTESDPYIIEGWKIRYQSMNGIEISDSSAHVIIRDVAVYGSFRYSPDAFYGIVLRNSSNIAVEGAYISGAFNGVLVKDAGSLGPNSVEIRQCTISRCWSSVYLMNSSNCLVDRNVIRNAAYSNVVVDYCSSTLISDNEITHSDSYTTVNPALSSGIAILDSTNITLRGNDLAGEYYDEERIEGARC